MLAARVLFVLSLLAFVGALNALRQPNTDRHPALRPMWLPALVTAEAVPIRVLVHAAAGALLIWAGALEHRIGWLGFWLTILTWIDYVFIQFVARRAKRTMADSLSAVGIEPSGFAHVDWRRVLAAYPYRIPRDVARVESIEYAPGLHLDVYRRRNLEPGPHPALLQIHGGSWRGGNRRQQARPLIHRMAQQGWICVAASYPLVPDATFPDQLVELKRALGWMREGGETYGIDPAFIAVTGGSAGGHLAALIALTANRPEYQPGFEAVDTSVQAAVPVYGIYDLLNRNETRDEWPIIPKALMKASKQEAEPRYRAGSPLDQIHPEAPPFFVVHGAADAVVPTGEADQFVAALRQTSNSPAAYAEIPGANHAFDVLDSLRTHYVISGIARFLDVAYELRERAPRRGR